MSLRVICLTRGGGGGGGGGGGKGGGELLIWSRKLSVMAIYCIYIYCMIIYSVLRHVINSQEPGLNTY